LKRSLAINHLQTDRVMAKVIQRIGPLRLKPRRLPTFQSIVHAIIHQQLSGKAAGTILGRFQALFGNGEFPTADKVVLMELTQLRQAGLSRAKAAYVTGLARMVLDGHIPDLDACHLLTDEELLTKLTTVKGVGRWTVEMLLIFNLGRPDVLPVHDLGVRRGYQVAYRKRSLPSVEHLERFGARWAPYRTTASLYLWRMADFLEDGDW
jgi:3-methyladenine DNA glycosylase/8-oxoguanine DNA glycosylase